MTASRQVLEVKTIYTGERKFSKCRDFSSQGSVAVTRQWQRAPPLGGITQELLETVFQYRSWEARCGHERRTSHVEISRGSLQVQIGVNSLLLVNSVKYQDSSLPLEKRVGLALAEVGPSITLANLTEFVVFSIGVFSSAPTCQVLSGFIALAILLQYVLQMIAFVALLTLDFKQNEQASIDCLLYLSIERSDSEILQTGLSLLPSSK